MFRLPRCAARGGEPQQADVLHCKPAQVLPGWHQQTGNVHQVPRVYVFSSLSVPCVDEIKYIKIQNVLKSNVPKAQLAASVCWKAKYRYRICSNFPLYPVRYCKFESSVETVIFQMKRSKWGAVSLHVFKEILKNFTYSIHMQLCMKSSYEIVMFSFYGRWTTAFVLYSKIYTYLSCLFMYRVLYCLKSWKSGFGGKNLLQ
jgi:hypothetical protein